MLKAMEKLKENPRLEDLCRLCLCEEAAVDIFPKSRTKTTTVLSIPMRIMACASLEVTPFDGFPKQVCKECRYNLEKFYVFRKRSQAADSKLRKHLRLLSLGKQSNVFLKNSEDESLDELEIEDSLQFIEDVDLQHEKQLENKIFTAVNNALLEEKERLKDECKKELRLEMEHVIRTECTELARKKLQEEITKECRQDLLNDLETFLLTKRTSQISKIKYDEGNIRKKDEIKCIRREPVKFRSLIKKNRIAKFQRLSSTNAEDSIITADNVEIAQPSTSISYEVILSDAECAADNYEPDSKIVFMNQNLKDQDEECLHVSQPIFSSESKRGNTEMQPSPVQSTEETTYQIADNGEEFELISKRNSSSAGSNDDEMFNLVDEIMTEEHLDVSDFGKIEVHQTSSNNSQLEKSVIPAEKLPFNLIGTSDNNGNTQSNKICKNVKARRDTDTIKDFKCASCPMEFPTESALARHRNIHIKLLEKGRSYECEHCKIVVSCRSALTRHLAIHTGERPHICITCGKGFAQREILKRHEQIHTGIRPHLCTLCEKSFSQRCTLNEHINRSHSNKPPLPRFSCHLCPKRFNHSSGLSRHLTVHSGLAFKCNQCERTFSDRSSIKRHIATIHSANKDAIKTEMEPVNK